MPEIDENQLMWLEEDGEDDGTHQEPHSVQIAHLSATTAHAQREHSAAISALEDELQRTRKELMDVRKELAAKTVQLSRKEVLVSQEKVAELAAHVAGEKDKQLASLATHVEQLELALGQKEEELEESRRLYNAQKRALREALAAAAEAEAAERQADEARARTVVAQVVEDELDRLQHELALLQARYNLEMRARDAELQSLRSELQAANASRKQAVAAAEAALSEAWQAELSRATEEATARVVQLEGEVARVRQQLEEQARSADTMALAGELASLNQQKVAIQREFDAFREMAIANTREHREAAARLLEENAALKSRLAARAFQDVQAGFKPSSKVFSARTGPGGVGQVYGGGMGVGEASGTATAPLLGLSSGNGWMEQLPEVLARLERQRKGLVPVLAVGGVILLFMLVAVIRAAAVTRSQHRGGLCFLAHLGINVGPGCGPKHPHSVTEVASEGLGHLLDQAPRVHDVEAVAEATLAAAAGVAAASSAGAVNGGAGSAAGTEGSAKMEQAAAIADGARGGGVNGAIVAVASQGLEVNPAAGAAATDTAPTAVAAVAVDADGMGEAKQPRDGLIDGGGGEKVVDVVAGWQDLAGGDVEVTAAVTEGPRDGEQTHGSAAAIAGHGGLLATDVAVVGEVDEGIKRRVQLRLLQQHLQRQRLDEGKVRMGRSVAAQRHTRRALQSVTATATARVEKRRARR